MAPVPARDLIERGDEAFQAGRYIEAQTAYREAAEARGDDLALRHQAAVSGLLAGARVEARGQALSVIRDAPEAGAGVSGDVARAAQALLDEEGAAPAPSVAEIEGALVEGRWRTAAHLAEVALADGAREIGPIRWAQGRALAALGRGAEGWAALTAAGAMGAADASIWWWLGALASGQGQRTLAREMRQISADLTPGGSPLGSREDR